MGMKASDMLAASLELHSTSLPTSQKQYARNRRRSIQNVDKTQISDGEISRGGSRRQSFRNRTSAALYRQRTSAALHIDRVSERLMNENSMLSMEGSTSLSRLEPSGSCSVREPTAALSGNSRGKRGAKERLRDAVSSVMAYVLPSHLLEGKLCRWVVRPDADAAILDDPYIVQLAPLLKQVLPHSALEENHITKHLAGENRLNETIKLMVTLLQAKLGHSRIVLVFEDVHWMDSSSWKLLAAVITKVKPLLLLLTMRRMDDAAKPAEYKKISACEPDTLVELSGLETANITELLKTNLAVGSFPAQVAQLIRNKSDGNPLWAMEFASSMREHGYIEIEGGECNVAEGVGDIEQIQFPSSVEALITSRMDRMPPHQLFIMKVVSVLGSEFSRSLVKMLLESKQVKETQFAFDIDNDLDPVLEGLCRADMIMRDPHGLAKTYVFKHNSLQEVAYTLLPDELKKPLHRAAAMYYEELKTQSTGPERRAGMRAMLASPKDKSEQADRLNKLSYHWARAGDQDPAPQRAVSYLKAAGDQALSNFALDEAGTYFEQALNLAKRLGSRDPKLQRECGPLERRIAKKHADKGEKEPALKFVNCALISLNSEPRPVEEMNDSTLRWKFRKQQLIRLMHSVKLGHQSMQPKDGSVKLGEHEQHIIEQASAYELLAQLSLVEHKIAQAGYCAMTALNFGYRLPFLTPVVARSYASLLQVAASSGGSNRQVQSYKRKALDTCEQLYELSLLSYTLLAVGANDAGNARWADAEGNLQTAVGHVFQLKDKRMWEECMSHHAQLEFYRGNFTLSKELFEKAMKSATLRNDKQIQNRCNSGIAGVLLIMDEREAALNILKLTNSFGQSALCLYRSNKREEALEKALQVKDRFRGPRTKYYVLKAYSSTAEVFIKLLEESLERQDHLHHRNTKTSSVNLLNKFGSSSFRLSTSSSQARNRGPTSQKGTSWLAKELGGNTARNYPSKEDKGSPTIDNTTALQDLTTEWIDKLSAFGSLYAIAQPRALLLRGQHLLLNHRRGAALKVLRESLRVAKKLQMPYDAALAEYELGKHASTNAEALKFLRMALEKFENAGAMFDVRRTQQQIAHRSISTGVLNTTFSRDHDTDVARTRHLSTNGIGGTDLSAITASDRSADELDVTGGGQLRMVDSSDTQFQAFEENSLMPTRRSLMGFASRSALLPKPEHIAPPLAGAQRPATAATASGGKPSEYSA